MKTRLPGGLALLLLTVLLSPVRAGSEFENIVKKMLGTMEGLTTTLGTIRGEETAKAAKPELRKQASQWAEIKKKADGLPPPSKEEKERLAKEYKTKLEEAQKNLFKEVRRVMDVAGGREALLEISSVLAKNTKK